jgi:hypothetical protein
MTTRTTTSPTTNTEQPQASTTATSTTAQDTLTTAVYDSQYILLTKCKKRAAQGADASTAKRKRSHPVKKAVSFTTTDNDEFLVRFHEERGDKILFRRRHNMKPVGKIYTQTLFFMPLLLLYSRFCLLEDNEAPGVQAASSSTNTTDVTIIVPRFHSGEVLDGSYPSALQTIRIEGILTPEEAARCLTLAKALPRTVLGINRIRLDIRRTPHVILRLKNVKDSPRISKRLALTIACGSA